MSINFNFVIGNQSSGKSSLVRSLTGIYNDGSHGIKLINGPILNIYAKQKSLQEAGITPQVFLNNISSQHHTDILVALRINKFNCCPDANSYIQYFKANGHNINCIIVLGITGPGYTPSVNPSSLLYIPNSINTPINISASQARAALGWM